MPENKQQQQIREITDKLEQGIQEMFESERYMEYLRTMSKFHNYSLNNTLLIAMQKPDATLVAGYTTWKNQFGRQVQRNEKAIRILAPAPYKVKVEMEKIDPKTQKPVLDPDGNPVKEPQEITKPAFKVVSVFDVSQTDGRDIPTLGVEELRGEVEKYDIFFEALKRSCPVPMEFEEIQTGAKGYYHQVDHRIAIQQDMSQVQTVKTAIHEMAHQKLHAIENQQDENQKLTRNGKEVEAESVAYTICQHFGIDTSDYSFSYIAGWSAGKETPELKASLNTIRRAASEMITEIEGHVQEIVSEREEAKTNRATQLAEDIDRFAESFAPYDYRDTVGGEENAEGHIAELRKQLLSGENAHEVLGMMEYLNTVAADGGEFSEEAGELSLRLMEFVPEGTKDDLEQQTLDIGLLSSDEAALRIGSLPEEEHYVEISKLLDGSWNYKTFDEGLEPLDEGFVPGETLKDAKDVIVSNYQWTGLKQNLLIFSDFAEMKELAQSAKEKPLLDATHPEFLNHDEITVRAADRSNFDGMIVFASEDGKVLLGRQENYDNRGHYDNHDRSMLYLSDDSKVYGLLCGDGFVKTKAECLAGGIFSAETFAEFDRLKQTILTQFNQTKEQFFGEPVTDAALKIGFDNYLEIHVASDGSWDYTLYDAQYLEIDGGQIGDADMSYDTATEEILKSHGLGTKTVKPMDVEELENATRFAEAKRLYDQGFVYDDYVLRTAVSVEMEEAMDAKFVCHEDFTDEQKEILYATANKKLPYDVMLNPEFTAEHMQFLSEMMEKGYDVEAAYVAGKQISLADHPMQVSEIADVKRQMEYDNIPKMLYTNEQWKEIQEGMRKQLDVSVYAKKEFSPEQMTELRRGLLKGIDVTAYADPAYDAQQMRFLRRGLESGFDVSIYNNPAIPASDMKSLYFALRDGTKVPGLMETNAWTDKSSLTAGEDEKTVFRYYSTQRPIMPGSYPNGENKPISITNFDTREPIGAGTMQAWGYLEYAQPLTEKQLSDYELRKPPVQHFKKEQTAIACPAKEVEADHGKKASVMDNLRKKQALISGQAKPELMPNKRKAVIE